MRCTTVTRAVYYGYPYLPKRPNLSSKVGPNLSSKVQRHPTQRQQIGLETEDTRTSQCLKRRGECSDPMSATSYNLRIKNSENGHGLMSSLSKNETIVATLAQW